MLTLPEQIATTALIAYRVNRDWKDAVAAASEKAVEKTGRPSGHRELVERAITIAALALDHQENRITVDTAQKILGGE